MIQLTSTVFLSKCTGWNLISFWLPVRVKCVCGGVSKYFFLVRKEGLRECILNLQGNYVLHPPKPKDALGWGAVKRERLTQNYSLAVLWQAEPRPLLRRPREIPSSGKRQTSKLTLPAKGQWRRRGSSPWGRNAVRDQDESRNALRNKCTIVQLPAVFVVPCHWIPYCHPLCPSR